MPNKELYNSRLKRVQDAIDLKEPDQMPLVPMISGLPLYLYADSGVSHKSLYYGCENAAAAFVKFHEEFSPDIANVPMFASGVAQEIAEPSMIDWPGRPGTKIADTSTFQIIENEFMTQDEYSELVSDYTGFIFRKYIPRAFPGLSGFSGMQFNAAIVQGIQPFASMLAPSTADAFRKLIKMSEESAKVDAVAFELNEKLAQMGFPPFFSGFGEVPFDIISDYFRGTMGMFFDQVQCPEKIAEACELFTDIQIPGWEYLKSAPMPVKRVLFPLHKGMDGFISDEQYAQLYWKPFQKLLKYLISIDVTPIIYTEGPYDTRVKFIRQQLEELPVGKCIIHFEQGDFAALKKEFEGIACLCGGMPLYPLEWGTKEQVVDIMKYLIDNCAPGGGYLFDVGAGIQNAKRENIDAMFDTARTYGKK